LSSYRPNTGVIFVIHPIEGLDENAVANPINSIYTYIAAKNASKTPRNPERIDEHEESSMQQHRGINTTPLRGALKQSPLYVKI